MTDITTSTHDKAKEHYGSMLAELAPAIFPLDVEVIDGLEVCNTEVGERHESFELGPFAGNRWLRISASDAVLLMTKLQACADDLATSVFDERDRMAKRCICGERIAPDDDTCGAERCEVEYAVGGF